MSASRHLKVLFFLVLLTIGFVACGYDSSEKLFADKVGAPIEDFVDIRVVGNGLTFGGSNISLYVTNKTNDCIVFPADYGFMIFAYQNGDWIKIPNKAKYETFDNEPNIVMDSRAGLRPLVWTDVQPDYSQLQPNSAQLKIRIVLVGKLCVKGVASQRETADYIELNIQP
jgi:hypothetical protein